MNISKYKFLPEKCNVACKPVNKHFIVYSCDIVYYATAPTIATHILIDNEFGKTAPYVFEN